MDQKDLTTSDSELVAQARGGHTAAFEELVRAHHGTVFAIGLAHLRNADEAEDLAQEVFLRAFMLLDRLKDGEKFSAWIGKMARNLAIDWQRRGAARNRMAPQIPLEEIPQEPADGRQPDVRQRLEQTRSAGILMEHIGQLPVHLREVVLLYYMEGLTQEEIAVVAGITQGAVASRLKTGLRKLRGALEPLLREGLGSMRARGGVVTRAVILVGAFLALPEMARAAPAAQALSEAGATAAGGGTLFKSLDLLRSLSLNPKSLAAGGAAAAAVGTVLFLTVGQPSAPPVLFQAYRTDRFDVPKAEARPWGDPVLPASQESTGTAPAPELNGWLPFGVTNEGIVSHDHNARTGALRVSMQGDIPGLRRSGWFSPGSEGMPLSSVGSDRYVRAKFYLYASGQNHPERPDEIPNFSVRAATRFAVTSELEVYHHRNSDPASNALSRELRPSSDPRRPSLYRLDFAPVMVPWLRDHAGEEGILRAFLAIASEPQMNGSICLAESVIGSYPASLAGAGSPVKVYEPDSKGAGGLASRPGDLVLHTGLIPKDLDRVAPGEDRATSDPLPTYSEGTWGVTMDTSNVPANRLGIVSREFFPGDDLARRVRAKENRQYKVRFHVTSKQASSANSIVRLKARSARFGWVQKLDLLGAWGTGGSATTGNNAIAQQALPGIGCANPDQLKRGEPGGWYTLLMPSPLNAGIRPEFPDNTPLSVRMPMMTQEPKGGENKPSRLDLVVGADLIDTLSRGSNAGLEKGNITIDRIEVYEAPLVAD